VSTIIKGGIMINIYRISESIRRNQIIAILISIIMGIFSFGLSLLLFIFFFTIFLNYSKNIIFTIFIGFEGCLFLFLGILQLLLAAINYWMMKDVRIITTSEKLVFMSPGLELHTAWNNIERVESQSTLLGTRRYDCIILHDPAEVKSKWWSRIIRRSPERIIPLSMFPNWRGTELFQEITKYVPNISIENK
jgi:hypothetical protein